ncbi:MAG: hypothetical protein U5K38_03575 [Woeseiaceae bacterium]|nr:hypothetical protein [Woeseiaceae bacterium]
MDGDVGRLLLAGETGCARRALRDWMALFRDRFYLQLSAHPVASANPATSRAY